MSKEKSGKKFQEFEHQIKVEYKAMVAIFIGLFGTITVAWILGGPLGSFMGKINGSFWYHLIPFLFSMSFFTLLVYKAYIREIEGLKFIAAAVAVYGLSEFIFMVSKPTGSIFLRDGNLLATLGDLMFPIAVILIYLHIELIEKNRPDLVHAILILGTAFPLIAGEIAVLILSPFPAFSTIVSEITKVVFVYLGVFSIIVIWISLFGFRIMYGTLKHSDSPDIARGSMFMLVGFASLMTNLALLGATYSSSLSSKPLLPTDFHVYNTWLLTMALLVMILAYIVNSEFAYSVNFDVYQLLVIHAEQGVTLFSFINEVRTDGDVKHAALQSPAILAVGSLIKEVASADGHVVLIKFDKSRQIIFSQVNEIVSVLITQKSSYFLNKGLEGFTRKFYERFEENITDFKGNVSVFEDGTELIKTKLPFMRHTSID